MSTTPRHIVVGRLRKPHGLKGDVSIFPLTDTPEAVFGPGKEVLVLNLAGEIAASPLRIRTARGYHREWLLKFDGVDSREHLEPYRDHLLAVPEDQLPALGDGEVRLADLVGFAVRDPAGTALGIVSDVYELPSGITLEIQGPKREFLLPFRKAFVTETHRDARILVVDPPAGLIDD
jgi:16S rRNA processing protein RimM